MRPKNDDQQPNIDKETLIRELRKIEKRNGTITPRAVVEAAQAADHPLHSAFEWDDGKASEKYREQQARQLLQRVRFEIQVGETIIAAARYVRDPRKEPDEQGYVDVERVKPKSSDARQIVARELEYVDGCLERVEAIAGVLGLLPDVVDLRRRNASLRKRLADESERAQL